MSFTLCTSGQALAKAGLNANVSGAALDNWSNESEGFFMGETRRDWITNAPDANISGMVADIVSAHIGNKIINYDMTNFPLGLNEAALMMDVNSDIIRKGIAILKDDTNQELNK